MELVELVPGTMLQNRYRILSLLRHGGMSRVYVAEDQRLRSQVALKEALFTQEKFRQAFAQEAGLLSRLRHRVLPHVTDYFTEGMTQYLVMQLFPGRDLEELLIERMRESGEAFAVNQVLRWSDQLLDALEYLHGQQQPIIHRDIKPRNLKLTEQGEVVLLDFGLAKEASRGTSQAVESLPGYTHHYAPLEQMRGVGTDPRTDLYALAATIYRLLTGHLPADALTRAAALLEHRPDPLRPANELNERVPEAVAAVLLRALAQSLNERPATASELRQALREASRADPRGDHETTSMINKLLEENVPAGGAPGSISTCDVELSPRAVTNSGRMATPSTINSVDESVTGASAAPIRPGNVRVMGLTLGLPLLTIAALVYWRVKRAPGPEAATLWSANIASSGDSLSDPMSRDEVMRFHLQVMTETGSTERVAGADPIVRGRWVKLHFAPLRPGYLYIVAPGAHNAHVMFLTAQPNPAWGVESNLLAAGTDYSFPPRHDKWIEVTRNSNSRTYTFIFAPKPLRRLRFLAGAAERNLTLAEEVELAEIRKQYGQDTRIDIQEDQYIVSIPAERANGAPFLFEVNLHQETNKERGKR